MPAITTAHQFNEVLDLARRIRKARLDVDGFESDRLGTYPDLTKDWEGGARDEFDRGWEAIATTKLLAVDQQMRGWEDELARMWADAAQRHNSEAYEMALREAGGALESEREEHNRAVELLADVDAMTFGIFTDQPRDRVTWSSPDVVPPAEATNYSADDSFLHYERHGNHWHPSWRAYPDYSVLGAL